MVPIQAEDTMRNSKVNITELPPMGPRRFIQLLIKAWPFMRPHSVPIKLFFFKREESLSKVLIVT